jgi:hypothetical protein
MAHSVSLRWLTVGAYASLLLCPGWTLCHLDHHLDGYGEASPVQGRKKPREG